MPTIDPNFLPDAKTILGALWTMASLAVGAVVVLVRGRVKALEYTVMHNRVAISTKDNAFGEIKVMLGDVAVTNLWTSRLELTNNSGADVTNLVARIYTRDETLLYGQRTELSGTAYALELTEGFKKKLSFAPGTEPTEAQRQLFHHQREYLIPVLNRGQMAVWTYLTTVPQASSEAAQVSGPSVWLDTLHPGITAKHRVLVPELYGVPLKKAAGLGVVVTVLVIAGAGLYLRDPWVAAAVTGICGLTASFLGALVYKMYRTLRALIVH